ncbi:MAG TPA: hypothetical protein VJX28_09885 [Chthoniobacterales bacterium]|nr:hypothetical protein [Chthoniobacterales bacterium]
MQCNPGRGSASNFTAFCLSFGVMILCSFVISANAGTITNAGSLTKQGSGTWTIDKALNAPVGVNINAGILEVNSNLATALVNINAGILEVNSNLTTALVNVQAGAMLKGTGVIGGLVVNAGVLAPGDSPGILT